MKANKKLVMVASFVLGATMFVTTAFADIASKTGYDKLKDSVKFTVKSMSEDLDNFTIESVLTVKDNNKVVRSENSIQKVDNIKGASESQNYSEEKGKTKSYYSYTDSNTTIWYNDSDDTYYVNEITGSRNYRPIDNPFEESEVKDLEKILDALVGDLKNYVVVEEKADGSMELSGSLDEGQIPALVNAVSSFLFKQSSSSLIAEANSGSSRKTLEDVFVKSLSGQAFVNKDGIMESLLATGVLSGRDDEGVTHEISIEMLFKVYDIGSTQVSMPNLEGKNVKKSVNRYYYTWTVTEKYIGKYVNDIIIEKDDKFIKIGERYVEIAHVDDNHVSGRYYEIYRDGYDEYRNDESEFYFDAEIRGSNFAEFIFINASGDEESGSIHFDMIPGKIYFYIPQYNDEVMYDGSFSRVFED